MMPTVRARLGPVPRSQSRESTAKRGILRPLGGSRRGARQEHGSQAAEVLRFVVFAERGVWGVKEGEWKGSACREGLRAIDPSAWRPATEVTGRLPTAGSRGAVNDGRAERASEVSPSEAR